MDDLELALEGISHLLFRWLINVLIFLIERDGVFYCFCLNLDSFKSSFQNYFHHPLDRKIFSQFLFHITSYLTFIVIHLHLKFFPKGRFIISALQLEEPIKPPLQTHGAMLQAYTS